MQTVLLPLLFLPPFRFAFYYLSSGHTDVGSSGILGSIHPYSQVFSPAEWQ